MPDTNRDFPKELDLLVDRLRSMSLARLAASLPPFDSRADAVRALIDDMAEATFRMVNLPVRPVPRLGDESVGDQLCVIGYDFLKACDDDEVLASFQIRLKELKLSL